MDEWVDLIDRSPLLARPPSEIVNPFTGARAPRRFGAGDAEVLSPPHGPVGAIEPSPEFEQDGELSVYAADGKHELVRDAIQEIASALGANLEWFG